MRRFANGLVGLADILQGYEAIERGNETLFAQLDALTDMKFTYVVTWQMYGTCKSTGDPRAQDMLDLMNRYITIYRIECGFYYLPVDHY